MTTRCHFASAEIRGSEVDIIGALAPAHYLTGPYAAVNTGGAADDGQTSIGYNANTGEV